jgi:hypothetical protein
MASWCRNNAVSLRALFRSWNCARPPPSTFSDERVVTASAQHGQQRAWFSQKVRPIGVGLRFDGGFGLERTSACSASAERTIVSRRRDIAFMNGRVE